MPDPQFLIEAERVLRELEKELQERLAVAVEREGPKMDTAVGRLSFMDAYQQHQMDLHAQRKLAAQLASVHDALARVKEGTYGICATCALPIAPERLEFLPDTPFCTRCNVDAGR